MFLGCLGSCEDIASVDLQLLRHSGLSQDLICGC